MLVCTSTFYRAWSPASPPFSRASTCRSLTCRKMFGRKSSWRLLISIKIIYNHMVIISRPPPWLWLSSQCCSHCRWAGSRPPCPASLSASTWRCQYEDFFLSQLFKRREILMWAVWTNWESWSLQWEGVPSSSQFLFFLNLFPEISFVDFPEWLQQSFTSTTTFALFALEKWPEQEKLGQLFICCSHHPSQTN